VSLINISEGELSAFPCCDNCTLKRQAIPNVILTDAEATVLSFINCLSMGSSLIPDKSLDIIDVDGPDVATEPHILPTRQHGERLRVCCEALAQW